MGQNCCAGSRIYVQSGIYDAFIQKLKETVQQRIIGPPEDEKTVHGAQVSQAQLDRILRYVYIRVAPTEIANQPSDTSMPARRPEPRSK